MGTWNSKDGIWKPARERVAVVDREGLPQIYDGEDRGAKEYLKESGEEILGVHFLELADNIERAHEKKISVEKFTKTDVNTQEKRDKAFKEAEAKIVTHGKIKPTEDRERVRSGGDNTAGNSGHLKGGMSDGDPVSDAISSVGKGK